MATKNATFTLSENEQTTSVESQATVSGRTVYGDVITANEIITQSPGQAMVTINFSPSTEFSVDNHMLSSIKVSGITVEFLAGPDGQQTSLGSFAYTGAAQSVNGNDGNKIISCSSYPTSLQVPCGTSISVNVEITVDPDAPDAGISAVTFTSPIFFSGVTGSVTIQLVGSSTGGNYIGSAFLGNIVTNKTIIAPQLYTYFYFAVYKSTSVVGVIEVTPDAASMSSSRQYKQFVVSWSSMWGSLSLSTSESIDGIYETSTGGTRITDISCGTSGRGTKTVYGLVLANTTGSQRQAMLTVSGTDTNGNPVSDYGYYLQPTSPSTLNVTGQTPVTYNVGSTTVTVTYTAITGQITLNLVSGGSWASFSSASTVVTTTIYGTNPSPRTITIYLSNNDTGSERSVTVSATATGEAGESLSSSCVIVQEANSDTPPSDESWTRFVEGYISAWNECNQKVNFRTITIRVQIGNDAYLLVYENEDGLYEFTNPGSPANMVLNTVSSTLPNDMIAKHSSPSEVHVTLIDVDVRDSVYSTFSIRSDETANFFAADVNGNDLTEIGLGTTLEFNGDEEFGTIPLGEDGEFLYITDDRPSFYLGHTF